MEKQELLNKKISRAEELRPIILKGFKTEQELEQYHSENAHLYEEYRKLSQEIRTLKLELMTPEEKLEYYRQKELAKEKYKKSDLS
ncbi:hypothetical protein [Chryseobacterium viscerum]|uniref:Uncharacterized protein n=1 Tax=Chryseobacterium viscerum TaxID=1037377 RepID=A0A316WMB1_9FLAO|nr:hypothetical protein [Chryseobacterium viscerum]PWN62541.1 hypothetical protein C1634_007095 [Chryseobacterium viscerum]